VFDHVTIRVSNLEASRRFYDCALGEPTYAGEAFVEWGDFSIAHGGPVTHGLHVAFGAADRHAVDAWWERMTRAGFRSDGEPGPRPQYDESYYGAFVLDPDGNSVEAVKHDDARAGELDHLWLRTTDLAATGLFYRTIAPAVGIEQGLDTDDRVGFTDGVGSFTFALGAHATENVHLAFGVANTAAVEDFHRRAVAAGYRDNGAPGERPQYHEGYIGAYVYDPDGHNVEAVFHGR
jgi:catechol 2,3-dioxygenase-like lactoylglutathione lyase family enzyme